jgi:Protein of unknown function, DUF488
MTPIYTVGYAGWTPDAITALVDRLGATLVDIRLSPTSRTPHWCGEALTARMGRQRYSWLRDLGNRNVFTGGPIELLNPAGAIGPIRRLRERGPVILLCGCADVQRCHRLVAAEYLAAALPDATIQHLDPPSPSPLMAAALRAGRGDHRGGGHPAHRGAAGRGGGRR